MSTPEGETWPVRRPATVTELPLTPAQQRMWFIDRFHPGWPSHDEMVYRLDGPVDAGVLGQALTLVMGRHEAVWARFIDRDGEPVQVIGSPGRVAVDVVRLDHLPVAEREQRLGPLIGGLRVAPFDLSRAPLIHVTLVRLAPTDHVLCMVLHHIVADGTSWSILVNELRVAYEAIRDGRNAPLPPVELGFGDFVLWQHARAAQGAEHLEYWCDRLAGVPVLDLPTDITRQPERAGRGGTVHRDIGRDVAEGVERVARSMRCTPFMVMLAAYQVLLSRCSGQDDVCVASPTAGRPLPEFEPIVGLFINMLILRGDLSGRPTFRELLRRTRKRALEALSRQEIPYELIIKALDIPRDPSRTPLFQTIFSVHTQEGPSVDLLPGVRAEHVNGGDTYAICDLTLDLWRTESGLAAMLRFDRDLFSLTTAATLARQYETVLRAVVDNPDILVPDIPLDDATVIASVLAAGQGPSAPVAEPVADAEPVAAAVLATVLDRIEVRAAGQPDAVALVDAEVVLSYGLLDRRANQLSRLLCERGVRAGAIVAVCLPRTQDLIVTLLAIWKAGAAYLPLDRANPPARLAQLVADSGATHLVTLTDLADRLGDEPSDLSHPGEPTGPADDGGVLYLDREAAAIAAQPSERPDRAAVAPDALAYVIYTSGSTGTPKGVAVPHSAVASRVGWMVEHYELTPDDRVLQFATVSFDTHVEEIYPCLTSGAGLVLLPEGEQLPDFLAGPHATDLTVLDLPTPYWHDLVAHADMIRWPGQLRLVILGADQAQSAAVGAWCDRFADRVRLVNTYGPTETTVIATAAQLGPDSLTRRPPIGRPIAETSAYVLDQRLRPVPVGVAGELHLGGTGLAWGYLGRAGQTAARFVPDPFGPPGGRLYRTGDRVRWLPDGQLEFLGRLDQQVKIRGFRVEPGEIEARLLACPGVGQAVVVPRRVGTRPTMAAEAIQAAEVTLVAYVVTVDPAVTVARLREQLDESLPAYLMPGAFVLLDQMPLTGNGKVDLAALPLPLPGTGEPGPVNVPPRTEAEELVAAVWREVLGFEQVGVTDDFFAIGGHSLLATRVIARLTAAIGLEVPIRTLFAHRTVAGLAAAVEELLIADLADLSDEDAEQLLAASAASAAGSAAGSATAGEGGAA